MYLDSVADKRNEARREGSPDRLNDDSLKASMLPRLPILHRIKNSMFTNRPMKKASLSKQGVVVQRMGVPSGWEHHFEAPLDVANKWFRNQADLHRKKVFNTLYEPIGHGLKVLEGFIGSSYSGTARIRKNGSNLQPEDLFHMHDCIIGKAIVGHMEKFMNATKFRVSKLRWEWNKLGHIPENTGALGIVLGYAQASGEMGRCH